MLLYPAITVYSYWMTPHIEVSNFTAKKEIDKTPQQSAIVPKTIATSQSPKKPSTQPHSASANDLIEYSKTISAKYGLDYERFYVTINGESSFSSDPNHNNQSRGTAQYILSTWLAVCSNIDDRTDGYKSIACMGKMWSRGRMGEWDVYCNYWVDPVCTKRGLKPGFLKNFHTLEELLPVRLTIPSILE